MTKQWYSSGFYDIQEFLKYIYRGGFPCTDLSSVNALGQGLAGPNSSLFHELPRVIKLVKKTVPRHVLVKYAAENVASMKKEECCKITAELETFPYHLNCADAVPMQRPRLCWCSEQLEGSIDGLEFTEKEFWTEVCAAAPYPAMEDWIEPGYVWNGGLDGYVLPTALKSIVRKRPLPVPAGLSRCDSDTLARYEADKFRFPPYHYLPRFLFWNEGKWRLANSSEKELLLGYGYEHTSLCWAASLIKGDPQRYEDERLSLLGDCFSIYSFVVVAAALSRNFLPYIHYAHLAKRMGLAPGVLAPVRLTAPLSRKLQYGLALGKRKCTVKELNQVLLTKTNHTGSDIRLTTGEIMNPRAVVRQSICAEWWDWKPLFRFRWQSYEHINSLELRTILQAIRYHVSHRHCSHVRLCHVTDSYVCMSIIAKGRTSSKLLAQTLRRINAYLLAFGIYCILGHVESSQNPTDEASRI